MSNDHILHEMMSHVPILAHGAVERVLITAGADPGLAREILRHRRVRDVVQVEHDGHAHRVATQEGFDLVFAGARSESGLRDARGSLRAGGVVITMLGAPFLQPRWFFTNMKNLSAVFAEAAAYLVPVPGTFGGPLALGWGSNTLHPDAATREVLAARLAEARIETRYYTPAVHRASFALPRFVHDLVSAATCPREEAGEEVLGRTLSRDGWEGARRA